ncbi:MAG: DUF1636 family protein [Pseudomonadota bacterium]
MEPSADALSSVDSLSCEPGTPAVTLFVCRTCRLAAEDKEAQPGGEALLATTTRLPRGSDISVRGVRCLSNCKRGLSAAMVRTDGWTYVFGDLTLDSGSDLLAGATLFSTSPDGLMPWRGRPDCLKRGMIARVPPLSISEDNP